MSFSLSGTPEELTQQFFALQTPQDVAAMLEIKYSYLVYYLHRLPIEQQYTVFEIPKRSGGVRNISAPKTSLAILQGKLKQVLQAVYQPKKCVQGFVTEKCIRTNAEAHRKQKFVLNIDLEDFFPSINFGRVRGMFMAFPYELPASVATVLAQISCFNNYLPQGAPTSPIISNMVCTKLDTQLAALARTNKCFYTRYADDITFSTSVPNFPVQLAKQFENFVEIGQELSEVIVHNGFVVNSRKTRLQRSNSHQEVTGLTVNDKPNVDRRFLRQIRAMLHDWDIRGLDVAQERYLQHRKKHRSPEKTYPLNFKHVVRGKIEFVGMVRGKQDPIYGRLKEKYLFLLNRQYIATNIGAHPIRIFISYSSKDRGFAKKLVNSLVSAGMGIWIDINNIPPGANWSNAVDKGLQACNAMVLIMTPDAMESSNVENEWQVFHDDKKLIVPILWKLVNQNQLHFQLRRLQHIDFCSQDYGTAITILKKSLTEHFNHKISIPPTASS
jgi:RNA-directed DNA polymerase